jgi:hypothetical protein
MKNKDIIKQINSEGLGSPSKGNAKRHKKSPTAGTYDGSIKGLTGYLVPGEGNCWVYPRKGKDPEKAIRGIKFRDANIEDGYVIIHK